MSADLEWRVRGGQSEVCGFFLVSTFLWLLHASALTPRQDNDVLPVGMPSLSFAKACPMTPHWHGIRGLGGTLAGPSARSATSTLAYLSATCASLASLSCQLLLEL